MSAEAVKKVNDRPGIIYRIVRLIVRAVFLLYFRFRPRREGNVPFDVPLIVAVNHQSILDPVLVASAMPRKLRYMARTTLFRNRLFAWIIRSLGAIPVDREGPALAGLKKATGLLEVGSAVLIFPDSTRTTDGSIGEFQGGFVWLAQRAGAWIQPVVLSGADKAMHRSSKFPQPKKIRLILLEPLPPESLNPREGEASSDSRNRIAQEIRAMMVEAKAALESTSH